MITERCSVFKCLRRILPSSMLYLGSWRVGENWPCTHSEFIPALLCLGREFIHTSVVKCIKTYIHYYLRHGATTEIEGSDTYSVRAHKIPTRATCTRAVYRPTRILTCMRYDRRRALMRQTLQTVSTINGRNISTSEQARP